MAQQSHFRYVAQDEVLRRRHSSRAGYRHGASVAIGAERASKAHHRMPAATTDTQRMGRLDVFMNTLGQNHLECRPHRIMMPGQPRGGMVGRAQRSRGNAM